MNFVIYLYNLYAVPTFSDNSIAPKSPFLGPKWVKISVLWEQVSNSLQLERPKLFSKLDIRLGENTSEGEYCKLDIKSSEMDLEHVETCFEEASNLNTTEKSTSYYIAGYITHKENLQSTDISEI